MRPPGRQLFCPRYRTTRCAASVNSSPSLRDGLGSPESLSKEHIRLESVSPSAACSVSTLARRAEAHASAAATHAAPPSTPPPPASARGLSQQASPTITMEQQASPSITMELERRSPKEATATPRLGNAPRQAAAVSLAVEQEEEGTRRSRGDSTPPQVRGDVGLSPPLQARDISDKPPCDAPRASDHPAGSSSKLEGSASDICPRRWGWGSGDLQGEVDPRCWRPVPPEPPRIRGDACDDLLDPTTEPVAVRARGDEKADPRLLMGDSGRAAEATSDSAASRPSVFPSSSTKKASAALGRPPAADPRRAWFRALMREAPSSPVSSGSGPLAARRALMSGRRDGPPLLVRCCRGNASNVSEPPAKSNELGIHTPSPRAEGEAFRLALAAADVHGALMDATAVVACLLHPSRKRRFVAHDPQLSLDATRRSIEGALSGEGALWSIGISGRPPL
eukprot:CAMPEP_0174930572 /NCGR_PEP_ID=MMETSP1355-20121228/31228_1 /TAXON_ID=464990 /ORGANISM="Hemiselmis tepida, Strain CCMP443" /LENGTH=451 /DNA_ID=CAMNT_0016176877 /DNA_START=87 /DNA_END=1442 /DNA_ORIENTATION=+